MLLLWLARAPKEASQTPSALKRRALLIVLINDARQVQELLLHTLLTQLGGEKEIGAEPV